MQPKMYSYKYLSSARYFSFIGHRNQSSHKSHDSKSNKPNNEFSFLYFHQVSYSLGTFLQSYVHLYNHKIASKIFRHHRKYQIETRKKIGRIPHGIETIKSCRWVSLHTKRIYKISDLINLWHFVAILYKTLFGNKST